MLVKIFGAPFGARQNFLGARLGRKLAFLWGAKTNVRGATPPAPMYAPKKKNAVLGGVEVFVSDLSHCAPTQI